MCWGFLIYCDVVFVDVVIGFVLSNGYLGGDDVEVYFYVRYVYYMFMLDFKEVYVSFVGLMVMLNDSMVINYIIKYIY